MEHPIVRKVSIVRKNPNPVVQFPKMPNLYLGLIENKDKIKQDLVNKEYIPPPSSAFNNLYMPSPTVEAPEQESIPISTYLDELISKKSGPTKSDPKSTQPPQQKQQPIPADQGSIGSIVSTSEEDEEEDSGEEEDSEEEGNAEEGTSEGDADEGDAESDSEDEAESDNDDASGKKKEPTFLSPPPPPPKTGINNKQSTFGGVRPQTPHHKKRLPHPSFKQPIFESRKNQPQESRFIPLQQQQPPSQQQASSASNLIRDLGNPQQLPQQPSQHSQHHQPGGINDIPIPTIPSLRELNMAPKTVPNLDYITTNVEEENNKRELLFKFELLKKSYKDANIPEFSIHSDYKTMKQNYENTVRRLSIDSSVESYKTYLIGGFMVVEYALGSWMGFDMQGFTQQQITSLTSYERLLVELGEKSYVDEESQWPVEVRLLGLIIMNAAFFIVSKLITKKTGSNILGIINSLNQATSGVNANNNNNQQKRRPMKGPNINLENIPNFI